VGMSLSGQVTEERWELSKALGTYPTGYRVAKAERSSQLLVGRQAWCKEQMSGNHDVTYYVVISSR
jgi:hypothetical protein